MVAILMMSAKFDNSRPFRPDVIIPVSGFTSKVLSRDSNYIVYVVM